MVFFFAGYRGTKIIRVSSHKMKRLPSNSGSIECNSKIRILMANVLECLLLLESALDTLTT